MAVDRKPEFFTAKDIKISIIGCGYVGLPLALRFAVDDLKAYCLEAALAGG